MASQVGVGFGDQSDSKAAGRMAARTAVDRLGRGTPDLVVLVATGKHEPEGLIDGVRDMVGDKPRLIGTSAGGIITNHALGYDGYQVGAAAISSDTMRAEMFLASGLNDDEYKSGRRLGRQIKQKFPDGPDNLLFLYDSIRRTASDGGPALNLATPLTRGLEDGLGNWPAVAGGGVIGDGHFLHSAYQIIEGRVLSQSVLGLSFAGDVQMDTVILHGCEPASPYYTITRAEANVVYELDGRPALEVISEKLGPAPDIRWDDFPFFVTLGLNNGDKFGPFKEENYANRLCFRVDKERKALLLFEPDLETGDEVQLMRRRLDLDYIAPRIRSLLGNLEGRRPIWAVYIDCIGRAAAYNGIDREDAAEVQKCLGDIPLFGFYSGVEVARCGSKVLPLDWTGVLCLFSE